MAVLNSSSSATLANTSRAEVNDHIRLIRSEIKEASGFLFAAKQADGSLFWFAGGDLDRYDASTREAAMSLYVDVQRFSVEQARS